jgi:exodeoxyribonuclease-3
LSKLRLLSWNVNGLRSVLKKGFLEWFAEESPDILCLQETKAAEDQLPWELRYVEGYHAYFTSGERKGYSGVALYSRWEPKSVVTGFGDPRFDNEGRIIIADYEAFVLLDIYFPNGRSSEERLEYKMAFYDVFLNYIDELTKQGRHVVICGDVNTAHTEMDIARPKDNAKFSGFLPMERAWMDTFFGHGYVDTFRMFNQEPGNYSFWAAFGGARQRNVGWRLDYFVVDEAFRDNVASAYILPEVMGSDHCPVGLDLALPD